MNRRATIILTLLLGALAALAQDQPRQVLFERISKYHHIEVYDEQGVRMLSFNGSCETRMSLADPLQGHFEYTEYFQMPFIWNPDIKTVLMAGLGGGSAQRSFQHYYTNITVDTVEIDPVVVEVAEKFFHLTPSPTLRLHTNDARQFLRHSTTTYDLILMDAYATTRYGSSIPPHLVTREFFQLANGHLGSNGVLCYNVIGQIVGSRDQFIAAIYRTLKQVFPQVYLFPAEETQNVVFLATKSPEKWTYSQAQLTGNTRIRDGVARLPSFWMRMKEFTDRPPPNAATATILTDDYCPIERLIEGH